MARKLTGNTKNRPNVTTIWPRLPAMAMFGSQPAVAAAVKVVEDFLAAGASLEVDDK
jgi:hypothetical protein